MTDKKIIDAELKNIQSYFEAKANMSIGDGKMKLLSWANAVRGAAELLKEQEPRLLTLEEVETLPYGYVTIETDKQDQLRWLDALLFSKNANFSFDFITLEGRARLLGTEYNREWRCWTSRPTDEQREAVKWDDGRTDF